MELESRWMGLLISLNADEEQARGLFVDLTTAYSEPHRHYHTLDHIERVLQSIDLLQAEADDLPAVKLAAWFHDEVYDPRRSDNEARSAAWAASALESLAIPLADSVSAMILATRSHENTPGDSDTAVLLDADLEVLGADEDRYREYAAAIRTEYAWVPEPDYVAGRIRVLRGFLDRPAIYGTARFRAEREEAARSNLAKEIRALESWSTAS